MSLAENKRARVRSETTAQEQGKNCWKAVDQTVPRAHAGLGMICVPVSWTESTSSCVGIAVIVGLNYPWTKDHFGFTLVKLRSMFPKDPFDSKSRNCVSEQSPGTFQGP